MARSLLMLDFRIRVMDEHMDGMCLIAYAVVSKFHARWRCHLGKTQNVPRREKSRQVKPRTKGAKRDTLQLTREERARLAAFDAVVKMRDEEWASMTPNERADELESWEKVKETVNRDRAGYRQVFVDE
jgi:hypothetical protein